MKTIAISKYTNDILDKNAFTYKIWQKLIKALQNGSLQINSNVFKTAKINKECVALTFRKWTTSSINLHNSDIIKGYLHCYKLIQNMKEVA